MYKYLYIYIFWLKPYGRIAGWGGGLKTVGVLLKILFLSISDGRVGIESER